jgi:hypothetical protein
MGRRLLHELSAVVAAGLLTVGPASAQSGGRPGVERSWAGPVDAGGCRLLLPGSDGATSHECLACHGSLGHGAHPYDLDYRRWGGTSGSTSLRPATEVVRRGLWLPDGQIRCVTCHDGRSPWESHIRLPAGSRPTHAVDRGRPQTYENPEALPPPRAGERVGTKPLCLGCHALD